MSAGRELLLAAALDAASRGWHVFPLRPGDKRPAVSQWQDRATTDPDRIRACWARGVYNVGIACGPSRLVVLDLDTARGHHEPFASGAALGASLPDGRRTLAEAAACAGHGYPDATHAVTTGSGGTHLYFMAPEGAPLRNTAGRIGPLVDTRAGGGYVVGAGSVVAGRRYVRLRDLPPAPLPRWLGARLRAPVRLTPGRSPRQIADVADVSRYAAAALRGECARVAAAEPGCRNHTLNAAAYSLGRLVAGGLLPRDIAAASLAEAARSAGLADNEIDATVRSGLIARARRHLPAGTAVEPTSAVRTSEQGAHL